MDSLAARTASATPAHDNFPFPAQALPAGTRFETQPDALVGRIGRITLHCRYQPIVSPLLMRIVGMEAQLLLRDDDTLLTFDDFIAGLDGEDRARLPTLLTGLQLVNAPTLPSGDEWLFLPVWTRLLQHGGNGLNAITAVLQTLQRDAAQLVLDLRDDGSGSDVALRHFTMAARDAGLRVAMTPLHFDRVLAAVPDMVRLEPALIREVEASPWSRRLFPHMMAQLQEAGSLVLVDGIASAAQAHLAIDANAEMLQGDWIAPAAAQLAMLDGLEEKCRELAAVPAATAVRSDTHLRSCFMTAWNAYHNGRELDAIVAEIGERQVTRLYAIDGNGFQIGATALTAHALRGRHHPLANATGACWARRHYFRNALAHPGRVQVTLPYLSLTEQRLCVTYSCMVMRGGQQMVLCMDTLLGPA